MGLNRGDGSLRDTIFCGFWRLAIAKEGVRLGVELRR